jgi:hypothetical protein
LTPAFVVLCQGTEIISKTETNLGFVNQSFQCVRFFLVAARVIRLGDVSPRWAIAYYIWTGFFNYRSRRNFGLLFYAVKVMHSQWKMYWAFLGDFFHKLFWSLWPAAFILSLVRRTAFYHLIIAFESLIEDLRRKTVYDPDSRWKAKEKHTRHNTSHFCY